MQCFQKGGFMANKLRADLALVQRGICESRTKAQTCIMAGEVFIDTRRVMKPSELIGETDNLELRQRAQTYVSRGGLKLEKALSVFHADVNGRVCMDIGAAAGGFTDVLLRSGAKHVIAIDVGYGQFDWKLRQDERVTLMERTNARLLTKEMLEFQPDVTVMDVSFISIRMILPVAAALMGDTGDIYTLIKPQFEAGRENVGKKGVVRNPETHLDVLKRIRDFVLTFGWYMADVTFSPITGPEGNIEFLAWIVPGNGQGCNDEKLKETVVQAHRSLAHA